MRTGLRERLAAAWPARRATQTVEPPSHLAQLTIRVGPQHRWGAAEGSVPGDQAEHLITTFGSLGHAFCILGCACAGITGAVLTLRASGPIGLAFAELGLAFSAALLITACNLIRARRGAGA